MSRDGEHLEYVYGLHPVEELLTARPREVERVWAAREKSRGIGPLAKQARKLGIPISYVSRDLLRKRVGARANHQGIVAAVAPRAYADASGIAEAGRCSGGVVLLVDRVVDPGNLGSILRSAAASGVAGVILGASEGVGLSPAVLRASAGAAERVPVARVERPSRWLEDAVGRGFRAVGLDARGDRDWDRLDWSGPRVVVAGGEARGIRPGLLRLCDDRARIPLASGVESLNVGVAVGVLLFEAVRQKRSGSAVESPTTRC